MDPVAISAETTDIYASAPFSIASLLMAVILIAALWRIFTKAGQPGWASIVPIYNYYVMLKVVGRPGWWLILLLVPFVNIIVWAIVQLDLSKAFGKGLGFAIGLVLLPGLFHMILGFGGASYQSGQPTLQPA
jgi:hypothetical protein